MKRMEKGQLLVLDSGEVQSLGQLYTCPTCNNLTILERENAQIHEGCGLVKLAF
jgi:hypothetical protein